MSTSISISGLIQDMLNMGFDTSHCLSEMIDDPFGAGAKNLVFHLDSSQIILVDDGPGMIEENLVNSHILFNRSQASDDRQGRFGLGSKVAKVYFTQNKNTTTTISKTVGGKLNQIKADWKRGVEKNELPLIASEASSENEKLWDKYSIDAQHGTINKIPVDKSIYDALIKNLPELIKYFEIMYSEDLKSGRTITFVYGTNKFNLRSYNLMCRDIVPKGQNKINILELWQHTNSSIRIYYKNGRSEWVYHENGKQIPKEYPPKDKQYSKLGSVMIESSLNYRPGTAGWVKEDGGHFIRRMNKIIQRFQIELPGKGDYGLQKCISTARHIISFTSALDSLFGLEINKSHIKKDNIHKALWEKICEVTKEFSSKVYKNVSEDEDDKKPVIDDKKPVIDVKKPVIDDKKPVIDDKKPVIDDKKPVIDEKKASDTNQYISAYTRSLPKSHKDILLECINLLGTLSLDTLNEAISSASTETQPGLVEVYKSTLRLKDYLSERHLLK